MASKFESIFWVGKLNFYLKSQLKKIIQTKLANKPYVITEIVSKSKDYIMLIFFKYKEIQGILDKDKPFQNLDK